MTLQLIVERPAPKTRRTEIARRLRSVALGPVLECPRCAGHEIIEARTGAILRGGKAVGGAKVHLCVVCLLRGQRVVVS